MSLPFSWGRFLEQRRQRFWVFACLHSPLNVVSKYGSNLLVTVDHLTLWCLLAVDAMATGNLCPKGMARKPPRSQLILLRGC